MLLRQQTLSRRQGLTSVSPQRTVAALSVNIILFTPELSPKLGELPARCPSSIPTGYGRLAISGSKQWLVHNPRLMVAMLTIFVASINSFRSGPSTVIQSCSPDLRSPASEIHCEYLTPQKMV